MKKLFLFLVLAPLFALSQLPEPLPETYINDLSGQLTAIQVKTLNDTIAAIEKRSSVQVAVVILKKLPENISIEDYATGIGRKWHVGNANNGLVYILSISQRKQRLEVARALQSRITDLEALRLTDAMKPGLRNKDYFNAILVLLQGISDKLNPVLKEQLALAKEETAKKDSGYSFSWWLFFGLVVLVPVIIICFKIRAQAALLKKNREKTPRNVDFILPPFGDSLVIGTVAQLLWLKNLRRENAGLRSAPKYNAPLAPEDSGDNDISFTPHPPRVTPSYTPPDTSDTNKTSYGDWGSGSSSDSQSSGSGFDGGGASNDF